MEWVCTVSTGELLGKGLQRTVGREFLGEEEEEVVLHGAGAAACSWEWWTCTWDEEWEVRLCWPVGVACFGKEVSMGEETKLSSN